MHVDLDIIFAPELLLCHIQNQTLMVATWITCAGHSWAKSLRISMQRCSGLRVPKGAPKA